MPSTRERSDKSDSQMRRRPMRRRKKVCVFCADKNKEIDYKDVNMLKRYISERGKILYYLFLYSCLHRKHILSFFYA